MHLPYNIQLTADLIQINQGCEFIASAPCRKRSKELTASTLKVAVKIGPIDVDPYGRCESMEVARDPDRNRVRETRCRWKKKTAKKDRTPTSLNTKRNGGVGWPQSPVPG